jgi:hypothetical protein
MVLTTGMFLFPVILVFFAFQSWKELGQSSWR